MTDEERKEQTKKVYALKMWERYVVFCPNVNELNGVHRGFTRVPGGWLVDKGESICFVPMHKESEHVCTCQSKNIKI